MIKVQRIVLLIATVTLLAAGCTVKNSDNKESSQSNNNSITASLQSENTVEIKDYAFSPKVLTVKKGTTVTWTNRDSTRHNVVAQNANSATGPKSELLSKDQSYSFTFNVPGTYDYLCEPHPYMTAQVVVTE